MQDDIEEHHMRRLQVDIEILHVRLLVALRVIAKDRKTHGWPLARWTDDSPLRRLYPKDVNDHGARGNQRQSEHHEQSHAQRNGRNVVQYHVAQAHPGMRQQRCKKGGRSDAYRGIHHPAVPCEIGMRRIDGEVHKANHYENEHVERSDPLQQPRVQSGESDFHSNTAPASSATAMPARFTAQALRRAAGNCEPMSTSLNRWRVPANRWCASAHTNTTATIRNARFSNSAPTSAKACGPRKDRSRR